MTQVIQRNNHVLQMLKRLKETLDNDKKKYADKVNVLVMTWERIAASAKEQRPLAAICIVEKMYRDTLSIMLQGEWPKMSPVSKTHLIQMLNRCRTDLCKEMPWLHSKFRKLLELVNDPWTLPSLERILHKDPSPATPEQIIEFCESERGLLIVTRLTMLCSSRCEKVAIKLAEACFGALSTPNSKLLNLFTTNEYNFIFDIYLCLLYKYKKLESIINVLKTVSVTDGYFLVCRLKKRNELHEQKIWKFSHQVAALAAKYFVTVSMSSRTIPDRTILKDMISDWLSMCISSENNVENEVRKVMQPAETSEHIYMMAEILTQTSQQSSNQAYSSLIMELYIRALTADINYLERVKLQNDKEQMTAYEKHLASKFLALADLVKDHGGVRREFVLTAFSIHPTPEIYRRVEEEAVASGKASPHSTPNSQESIEVGVLSEGLSSLSSEEPDVKETATDYSVNNDSQDSGAFVEISNRCPLHLPYDGIGPEGELCFQCGDFTGIQTPQSPSNQQQKKKERSLDALILIKGNTVTESLNYDVLSAPSQVLEAEKLGLSPQVCADLVTLLGSNRYHLLTWVLEWGELSSRCLRYMNEADTIKNGKKELKFLEIDYNQYKDWPENEEEADCIEKGYEQWLEDENTETDFDTDSKRSNTDDSEELMIKTAIKRSQKQTGRYAESSSDSESSRSRPRSRKRGRPRKRHKYYSDSGSVSDSLGSDGQKKQSSKKPRTNSKDLRKKLCTLKVLEMAVDANNMSCSNDSLPTEVLAGKIFSLPSSAAVRSDPTVLKSLRAFRPNPHKMKNDEFIHSVADSCFSSKAFGSKMVSNMTSSVFDCNDNKFITKDERVIFGNKDTEIHFKTSGVKTKKYNDVVRTINEDLISASEIPIVASNATVNVIHVQDSQNPHETANIEDKQLEHSMTMSLSSKHENTASVQKMKFDNDLQMRKYSSSQSSDSSKDINFSGPTNILSSALTRKNPSIKPTVSSTNQFVTTPNSRPVGNKVIGQSQYMTFVNKNSINQTSIITSQAQNALECRNISNSTVVMTNSVKATAQNFNNQTAKTPVQTARVVTVPTMETPKFVIENDKPKVVLGKNCTVRTPKGGPSALYNNVFSNSVTLAKKTNESNNITSKRNMEGISSTKPLDSSAQKVSRSGFSSVQSITNQSKGAAVTLKPLEIQNNLNESLRQNVSPGDSVLLSSSKSNAVCYSNDTNVQTLNRIPTSKSGMLSKSNMNINNSTSTEIVANKISHSLTNNSKIPQTVILPREAPRTNTNCLRELLSGKGSFQMSSNSVVKSPNNLKGINVSQRVSEPFQEDIASHSNLMNNSTSDVTSISLDVRNVSTAPSSTTTIFSDSTSELSNFTSNEASSNVPVNIAQGVSTPDDSSKVSKTKISGALNYSSGNENNTIVSILNSSSGAKLNSISVTPTRNILGVLTGKSLGKSTSSVSSSVTSSQYSNSNACNSVEPRNEGAVNYVMINQNDNTASCGVIDSLQENVQDSLNSVAGDMIERVVKQELETPQSIMSPMIGQVKNSGFNKDASLVEISGKNLEQNGSLQDLNAINQQQNILAPKKIKSSSSLPTVQRESNFIKKQVLNNQKITILVQNNNEDKTENQKKTELNELLLRDDQKTCITFRAIKRTQPDGRHDELPVKKKETNSRAQNNEGNNEKQVKPQNTESVIKEEVNSSETLCQYLVLEAINDPSGALPKFNQAFGKSYQVKIPQAVEISDSGGNEGTFGVIEQKADTKLLNVPRNVSMNIQNQVPVTEPSRGSTFEIIQRPVKSVYIDKEVKTNIQHSVKANEGVLASSNISTIQMTEVQQAGINTYQNIPKVSRSSVVQQLLKKVPTGPATFQAVNSVNTLTTRQVKTQDIVSGSTLIYATETRAQSQIVIQRAIGRVSNSNIGQAGPVIYSQTPNDQVNPPTQALLLTAVPSGTRGVPSSQFVRLPSSSGVWKMTPSVNPPRIVQLRPQNLILQNGQEQGFIMPPGQSLLLHHLTSLPVKPVSVVTNNVKMEQAAKIEVKNDIFVKSNLNVNNAKIRITPLENMQAPIKSENSSLPNADCGHETVSLMKDIKEFENVFEETKLKFEMEEQQGVCLSEVETVTSTKTSLTHSAVSHQPIHQRVLVQPQIMLHKPQMILTPAAPNQQIFTQKIDKQITLDKDSEKRLIVTTKQKLGINEGSSSHVAVAYVSRASTVTVQKPVVVVTNYTQSSTSSAPSVTTQSSPTSNSVVSSVSFTSTTSSSTKPCTRTRTRTSRTFTHTCKPLTITKSHLKSQDDPSTTQKIFAILEEYAMQVRNSPDMNNRPAPRRRTNTPTNIVSKKKKTLGKTRDFFSEGDTNFVDDITDTLQQSNEHNSKAVKVLQVSQ